MFTFVLEYKETYLGIRLSDHKGFMTNNLTKWINYLNLIKEILRNEGWAVSINKT